MCDLWLLNLQDALLRDDDDLDGVEGPGSAVVGIIRIIHINDRGVGGDQRSLRSRDGRFHPELVVSVALVKAGDIGCGELIVSDIRIRINGDGINAKISVAGDAGTTSDIRHFEIKGSFWCGSGSH